MEDFVLEKQVATSHEYDWIITALKGMASAYTNKCLETVLEKIKSVNYSEDSAVSVDLVLLNSRLMVRLMKWKSDWHWLA